MSSVFPPKMQSRSHGSARKGFSFLIPTCHIDVKIKESNPESTLRIACLHCDLENQHYPLTFFIPNLKSALRLDILQSEFDFNFEPKNKMVNLLPWEQWPFEFEVQKNDNWALIIEILYFKQNFFEMDSSLLPLTTSASQMQSCFKIDLGLSYLMFNFYV